MRSQPSPAPDGLTARALTHADLDAAFTVYAEAERAELGQAMLEPEDIESDWARPSFDLATQSVGVFDGDQLIAAAEVFQARRAEGAVLPSHQGRGVGSWLVNWLESAARRDGGTVVGQTKVSGCPGERMLRARGYAELWTSWVLEVPGDAPIPAQPLPPGYTLRTFGSDPAATEQDEHAAYQLIEDAFNEWPERTPARFEDWRPRIIGRRGFEPWMLRFALDADGTPVGVACTILDSTNTAYVDQLAVRADHRGRGLARALLVDAFGNGRDRGAVRSELSTDSRTGALGLYERVGMQVTQTWHQLAVQL